MEKMVDRAGARHQTEILLPANTVSNAADATGLPEAIVKEYLTRIKDNDTNILYNTARDSGLYAAIPLRKRAVANLRCLLTLDISVAEDILSKTIPPGNIIHAIERAPVSNKTAQEAIVRFTLGISQNLTSRYYSHNAPSVVTTIIDAILRDGHVSTSDAQNAKLAYYTLMDTRDIKWVNAATAATSMSAFQGDFEMFIQDVEHRNLCNANIARMRKWQEVPRDEIQSILFDCGRGETEQDARNEHSIRQLMSAHNIDHQDASSGFEESGHDLARANAICSEYATRAGASRAQFFRRQPPIVPSRDTRHPPNVGPKMRTVAILGVDEYLPDHRAASPSEGDGWMVSDFYLWMHVLDGMGKTQEWITSLEPRYLLDKYYYCLQDKTAESELTGELCPVRQKWATGFLHGDAFEERTVVLDEDLLPIVKKKITIAPHGLDQRDFVIARLESTLAAAEVDGDPVLLMAFSHGDWENGGLLLGGALESVDSQDTLSSDTVATLLRKYPTVNLTIFMTSCYSGHWVETATFQGQNMNVLAAAKQNQEESFAFEWSISQRHCGGLFSSERLSELLEEPSELPPDADADTSRQYRQVTSAILAKMYRLCLPANINAYGSEPVFTGPEDTTEKFWKRTGYELHSYRRNYNKLRRVPASDPHPKIRSGSKFEADLVYESHPDAIAWKKRHPNMVDSESLQATAGYGGTRRGLNSRLNIQFLIKQFLATNPWPRELDQKSLQRIISSFNKGTLNEQQPLDFQRTLLHRLHMNDCANQYVQALDLYKAPPIEEWGQINARYERYGTILDWARIVTDSGLFKRPPHLPGPYYRKPVLYLAWVMLEAGENERELMEAIRTIWRMRRDGRFSDVSVGALKRSSQFSQSVSFLRDLLRESWNKSKAQRQPR